MPNLLNRLRGDLFKRTQLFKGQIFQDVETPNVSGDFNLRREVMPVKELIHFCDTISTQSLPIKHPLLDGILYLCLGTVHTSLKLADPKKSTQFI